ncbi:MAG: hypothetical protein LKI24_08005 [Acidipropionibacterium sp.]|nr:hypothetical protein [Acidipropionibacterium sp.]
MISTVGFSALTGSAHRNRRPVEGQSTRSTASRRLMPSSALRPDSSATFAASMDSAPLMAKSEM